MRPTALLSLRRSIRSQPTAVAFRRLPLSVQRHITIQSSAGRPDETPSDSSDHGETNFELISGSSQHPFASAFSEQSSSSSSSQSSSSSSSPSDGASAQPESSSSTPTVVNQLPQPPPPYPSIPLPHLSHPFDTHAFVTYLQRSEVNRGSAVVLMEAVRDLIIKRKLKALQRMLSKEENENLVIDGLTVKAAYLFRAALSELRAELSVRAKSDSLQLQEMTLAIRREIDGLEQNMKESVQTLKHDIEMDMNNRKSETRSEQKMFDLAIEEINNKFTISLGDLRTEIESAKWESVRRAMSILVVIVVTVIGASTIYSPAEPAAAAKKAAPVKSAPIMRDMAVGTDDEDLEAIVSDQKLERILSDKEIPPRTRSKRVKPKKQQEELMVDRI